MLSVHFGLKLGRVVGGKFLDYLAVWWETGID